MSSREGQVSKTGGVPAVRGRYWIRTYGCQMNVHDSEIYAGQMRKLGFVPAESSDDADLILVNTCSVREKAEEKLFSELGRLRSLKAPATVGSRGKGRAAPLIGVTGCIAQQRGAEIIEREASVDFILGTRAIRALPSVLEAIERGEGPQVNTDDQIDFDASDADRSDRVKAFVTIMEGCNNYCSFCIVPATRGMEIYRSGAEIIDEVRGLSLRGYREVTLLGQNVNSWLDEAAGLDFPGLLCGLDAALAEMPAGGVERIRFLTSHPKDLSPRLIDAMASCSHVASHLHLPVQSGSDRVLRQMNRHYTRGRYLELVAGLRAAVPDVGLSTDLIVGFPGEDDADFEATLELVRAASYDSFYSFEYSPRPETAALMHEDTVAAGVKRRRLIELQALQRDIQRRKNAAWQGRTVEVLVDGFSKRSGSDVSGRTSSNQIVNFSGGGELIGRLVDVTITAGLDHSLYGTIAGEPR
ncbi:MAG TPA: tRNA (N6-isopentenyl adenosine(37)-C2)-methylthiotransferase MiaB [Acidobacteriota bacterium]